MTRKYLNLDDFPDSAYADELRRGLGALRFNPPLEAEYARAHLQRVRLRVRVWFSLTVVLALSFTLDQVHRGGVGNLLSLAHIVALIPCTMALVGLAWSRLYDRLFLRAAALLVPVSSGLISVFIAHGLAVGREEELAGLAVNLVAVFFFAGLMYRQALIAWAIMVAAFAVAAVAGDLPLAMLIKSLVIVVLTSGIAAIVYWDIEQSSRRNFLEGGLIRELVVRDGLSGLMNRRAFDEHILRVWQHAVRDGRSLAVMIIDIDHFKRYNDNWGHQAGDLAIRSVAQAIQGVARRPLDMAARYGGEEFAVVLYDLAHPHVADTAERLRETVQKLTVRRGENDEDVELGVTVSIGVGIVMPTIGRTPRGAIQLADEALYEAKQAGRNRVVVRGVDAYVLLETGTFARNRHR